MQIKHIDTTSEVLLIAEIGNNHEGDFDLALRLISLAAQSGAQAVKFQTIEPERLVHPSETARLKQLKGYAFSQAQYEKLALHAENEGVLFLSTPFSLHVVDWLNDLVAAFKIASGDNNFSPLLEKVAAKGKPVILSTGMSELDTVKNACKIIQSHWPDKNKTADLALLHCISSYPTEPDQAHLACMLRLLEFSPTIGYSDHTLGIDIPLAAVAAGAQIIEKHFTLDKNHSDFRDHQLSADPDDLRKLKDGIDEIKKWMGSNNKLVQSNEIDTAKNARRSIVLKNALEAGQKITLDDLDWLRPANGISPDQTDRVIGQTIKTQQTAGTVLSWDMIES